MMVIEQFLIGLLSWLPEDLQEPTAMLLMRFTLALVYLIVGLWISGWVSGWVHKGLSKVKEFDQTLTPSLSRFFDLVRG